MKIGYIDGAALDAELKKLSEIFNGEMIDFNYLTFCRELQCQRVFYYDSLPVKKPNENDADFEKREAKKLEFFSNISKASNIHIKMGASRFKKNKGLHQKAVDVLLATDALYDALTGVSDQSVFVLSDLDFYPLFDRLAHSRAFVELRYWRGATAPELIEAVDGASELNYWSLIHHLSEAQRLKALPEVIQRPGLEITEQERLMASHGRIGNEPCAFWFDENEKLYVGYMRQNRIKTPFRKICLEYWVKNNPDMLDLDQKKLP